MKKSKLPGEPPFIKRVCAAGTVCAAGAASCCAVPLLSRQAASLHAPPLGVPGKLRKVGVERVSSFSCGLLEGDELASRPTAVASASSCTERPPAPGVRGNGASADGVEERCPLRHGFRGTGLAFCTSRPGVGLTGFSQVGRVRYDHIFGPEVRVVIMIHVPSSFAKG